MAEEKETNGLTVVLRCPTHKRVLIPIGFATFDQDNTISCPRTTFAGFPCAGKCEIQSFQFRECIFSYDVENEKRVFRENCDTDGVVILRYNNYHRFQMEARSRNQTSTLDRVTKVPRCLTQKPPNMAQLSQETTLSLETDGARTHVTVATFPGMTLEGECPRCGDAFQHACGMSESFNVCELMAYFQCTKCSHQRLRCTSLRFFLCAWKLTGCFIGQQQAWLEKNGHAMKIEDHFHLEKTDDAWFFLKAQVLPFPLFFARNQHFPEPPTVLAIACNANSA